MADAAGQMPWWKIIAILVVVALVVGAGIGLLGFSTTWAGVGVGAALGVVAATLISRRRNQTP